MPKHKPVIFVIDDDISVRRALGRLIRSAGLVVRTFSSAQEFLDEIEGAEADCLILDIRMPGMNGLELQEQLVASKFSIPIIFLTAREDTEAYRRAMRQGAFAFLQKPCDDQALLDTIRKALDVERNTPA